MTDIHISDAQYNAGAVGEPILRAPPEWFGIESAIVHYVETMNRLPTFIACQHGAACGFLSAYEHNPYSAEIYVMAVLRESHRQGIGRVLVQRAEAEHRRKGFEFMQVKTLGEARTNAEYAQTRAFHAAVGYRPSEEFEADSLWPGNPCLILVKSLARSTG